MNVIIVNSEREVLERAACLVSHQVTKNPCSTLGLGLDPILLKLYATLVEQNVPNKINLRYIKAFCAREKLGKSCFDSSSELSLVRNQFLACSHFNHRSCFAPSHEANQNPAEVAENYEALIDLYGGIDLQILSLAADGTFQGNTPGSNFNSSTRVVHDVSGDFKGISFGLGTIRQSKQILLIVTGAEKAGAVAAMLESPASISNPASCLQFHKNITVILDQDSASELKNADRFTKSFHGRLQIVRGTESRVSNVRKLKLMDFIQNTRTTTSTIE